MKILRNLFLLGIFFLPFNSFEGFSFIGEYAQDSVILFFFPLSVLIVLFTGKFVLPFKDTIFQVFLLFFIWVFISMFFNLYDSYFYYFKGTSGYNRFFRQLISLSICSLLLFSG